MAHIVGGIVQNIGGGIGFTSEAYKAHKAKKTQAEDDHTPYQESQPRNAFEKEEAWELDEAQDELVAKPGLGEDDLSDPAALVDSFLLR